MIRLLPLLGLLACGSAREGIAVGNPGQGMSVQVEHDVDLAGLDGDVPARELRALRCDGTWESLHVDMTLSAIGATPLPLPDGVLCGVELLLDGPVWITGHAPGGSSFALELSVGAIRVETDEPFTTLAPLLLVLGPGPWLTADDLGLDAGDVVIDRDHPRHDELAELVARQSMLCEDRDGDRLREIGDRVVATGPDLTDPSVALPSWQSP